MNKVTAKQLQVGMKIYVKNCPHLGLDGGRTKPQGCELLEVLSIRVNGNSYYAMTELGECIGRSGNGKFLVAG